MVRSHASQRHQWPDARPLPRWMVRCPPNDASIRPTASRIARECLMCLCGLCGLCGFSYGVATYPTCVFPQPKTHSRTRMERSSNTRNTRNTRSHANPRAKFRRQNLKHVHVEGRASVRQVPFFWDGARAPSPRRAQVPAADGTTISLIYLACRALKRAAAWVWHAPP